MEIISCCFTGHRPEKFSFGYNEAHPACLQIQKTIAEQIQLLFDNGIYRFFTGCALGTDLWAAEAVLSLAERHTEVELHCIIPFYDQPARWASGHRSRYLSLLEKSTETLVLQSHFSPNCFYTRNRYLVDHSNVVLAVYDLNEQEKSGTKYTVSYAQKQCKKIICIDPETAKISVLDAFQP